jgi:hypothetical protein
MNENPVIYFPKSHMRNSQIILSIFLHNFHLSKEIFIFAFNINFHTYFIFFTFFTFHSFFNIKLKFMIKSEKITQFNKIF